MHVWLSIRTLPVPADQLVKLGSGGVTGDLDEVLLGVRFRDARERANLRVRQLADAECRAHVRQLAEATGNPNSLPGRTWRDRASPREPMGARVHAPFGPTTPFVELGDQQQPAAGRRVDVGGELADLTLELLDRWLVGRWPWDGGSIAISEHTFVSYAGARTDRPSGTTARA